MLSSEGKAAPIETITAAFGKAAGETLRQNTSVRVHEIKSGDWGHAGQPRTTRVGLDMKAKG
ncbi:4-oxalocrotonate tautomerase [Roseibacterium beibuensis]|uniref:4-oxalocrotonate tautomerase n=1 Tax=[Roseibacterium] beibuensis TaxID=1193142 RepID=A0ABP9LFE1_9RHOB|nr:4-oxalocrotonate tautomerase [Roseibacterium beibuensis]MCS6623321.1 4-oxalocrotonate tautomerase [Roseibacterium beibuensis]